MPRVLFVLGTRPEAIKLSPVILHMRQHFPELQPKVCITAQHRELLDQVLQLFQIDADYDLNVMAAGQSLYAATSRMIAGLETVFRDPFDFVVVQGDTTTTFCGALAAFYAGAPVGHVEAGLRTGDLAHPFPEEMNRLLTTRLTALHFAATSWAAGNLRREGVADAAIRVTGNPVADAVMYVRDMLGSQIPENPGWRQLDPAKRWVVVTAHRRESFGAPFGRICSALRQVASRDGVQVVYPVHPNPNVRQQMHAELGGHPDILLTEPVDYLSFIDLLNRAYLVLTDSGGVQEEAPSLGKPVLILRETTERPEAVQAGTAKLVGSDERTIVESVFRLLDDRAEYERMAKTHNPYGDGQASSRICGAIRTYLSA